ncbi:hypothetical protein [Phenylobacterium sp.]|jgi:hypothetical protein|uniref:hypothetical protein n=1 Tax=Phenylobacterium sp. TaxID=1871053 RepID=UPI002F3FFDF7
MDIHKPKPWHGVREFLKEYLIIVVGVLTALGAESVVNNLHEHRLSEEAKGVVRDEMNVDITAYARRFEVESCVTRRMTEIEALLDAAEAGQQFTPPARIGGPREPGIYTNRWEAATAGGRTSLLSSEEQRQFGRVYQNLEHLELRQQEEYQAWLTLHALVGRRHLSAGMIDEQRLALSRARDAEVAIRRAFEGAKFTAQQLGVKGDAHLASFRAPPGPSEVCQPLNGPPQPS